MKSTGEAAWAKLDELAPWSRNPRRNDGRPVSEVAASIRRFGFVAPVVVWTSQRRVVAGHTRLKALRAILAETPDFVPQGAPGPGMVPVRWHEFASEEQADAYALADNRLGELAEWDDAGLTDLLRELSEADALEGVGWSEAELAALFDDGALGQAEDGTYTHKIVVPVYEPKGGRPPLAELFDDSKTKALIDEIDRADIPQDVAAFLRLAAERHTSFHFRNIAEYYCHAPPDIQALMERSALVIIDFNSAIENGFVRLTNRLASFADLESHDEE